MIRRVRYSPQQEEKFLEVLTQPGTVALSWTDIEALTATINTLMPSGRKPRSVYQHLREMVKKHKLDVRLTVGSPQSEAGAHFAYTRTPRIAKPPTVKPETEKPAIVAAPPIVSFVKQDPPPCTEAPSLDASATVSDPVRVTLSLLKSLNQTISVLNQVIPALAQENKDFKNELRDFRDIRDIMERRQCRG